MFLKQLEDDQRGGEQAALQSCGPSGVASINEFRVAYATEARVLSVLVARIQEAAHAQ